MESQRSGTGEVMVAWTRGVAISVVQGGGREGGGRKEEEETGRREEGRGGREGK